MAESRLWRIWRRFFEVSGMVFVGLVLPALIFFYGFILRPAFASMERPEAETQQRAALALSYVHTNRLTATKLTGVYDLYETMKDSVGEYSLFASGLPEGSIRLFLRGDSVAATLRYNLDCGCPAESKRFDLLCYMVDLTGEQFAVGENVYERGLNRDEYSRLSVIGVSPAEATPIGERAITDREIEPVESAGI